MRNHRIATHIVAPDGLGFVTVVEFSGADGKFVEPTNEGQQPILARFSHDSIEHLARQILNRLSQYERVESATRPVVGEPVDLSVVQQPQALQLPDPRLRSASDALYELSQIQHAVTLGVLEASDSLVIKAKERAAALSSDIKELLAPRASADSIAAVIVR